MGIFKFGSNFTPFIQKQVASLDGKKQASPADAAFAAQQAAQVAAEKKARIDAQGEEIVRQRAIEADNAAQAAQAASELKASQRADQLAAYRAQRAQDAGPIATQGGPAALPPTTNYSPQAARAAAALPFGTIAPPNGQVRGLSGQSLNTLIESLAAAGKK
jgi:hypothetical protein